MTPAKHLAEFRPELRLIVDEAPPLATKLWLVTQFGHGFSGPYHPEHGVVAWSPLPKFSAEQKQRLQDMVAAGIDPTKPAVRSDPYGT